MISEQVEELTKAYGYSLACLLCLLDALYRHLVAGGYDFFVFSHENSFLLRIFTAQIDEIQRFMADYRLLVLDLDGTLTNSKKEISPRNLATLLRLQAAGVKLVLASGRPTYGIAPLAEELQMARYGGFILSYNGGEIIDWSTKEMLYKNLLPDEVLPLLYETSKAKGHPILSYDGPEILTESPDNEYILHEAFLNKMQIRPVKNFLEETPRPLPKCLIVGPPEKLMATEAELSLRLQGIINVFRSEPFFLELVPNGIDKAQSLRALLAHLGETTEQMVCIGDGYNDLSMIELAGMGVAMANAQEPVRKAANYVTLSNDEDGVAAAVEHLFFNNKES